LAATLGGYDPGRTVDALVVAIENMTAPRLQGRAPGGLRHEALLYEGDDDFVSVVGPFVAEGVAAAEPVLVVVSAPKIRRLRAALGPAARRVEFADIAEVGRNPARIIPVWTAFVTDHAGGEQPVRGVGEPVWPGRAPDELVESQHHETLLNLAFADTPGLWLACPYDVTRLQSAGIAEARRSHPLIRERGETRPSDDYEEVGADRGPFDDPLVEPAGPATTLEFDVAGLRRVRDLVEREARGSGLDPRALTDLVVAVNELACNSVRHGGGRGTLRIWVEPDRLLCEVRDAGQVREALAGRAQPRLVAQHGRGLWLANQLCDLVQLRSSPAGTVVRVSMRRSGRD
jgi:anti-sigma regulatory factor (Ser/Thr protein kinase)